MEKLILKLMLISKLQVTCSDLLLWAYFRTFCLPIGILKRWAEVLFVIKIYLLYVKILINNYIIGKVDKEIHDDKMKNMYSRINM